MGKREQQNKRSFEQVEEGDVSMVASREEQMEVSNDTNNNSGNVNKTISSPQQKKNMNKKQQQQEQAHVKREQQHQEEEEFEDAEQDDEEDEDEEDVIEEEEEIEEEVEEEEDEEEDEEGNEKGQKSGSNQGTNQGSQGSGGQQNSGSNTNSAGANTDKRPRLTDELFEINLRRKKEHVGSALYIPFERKVTEEEVRNFVGQGPNIFLVGPQKQNAIVRYRTQTECEKQQKELAMKEFDGKALQIEPKTVKIDPANIDVKTLIVQYSNPDLTIMDFAQIFIHAISISLKGGKSKKESQEDLSFGSAIIIFPSHDEAKEAFLATENLNIKNEQLRVVFADFRPAGSGNQRSSGGFGFRNKGGDNNRGNFNRGGNQGGRQGGNFRNRNRQGGGGGGGGGGQRNFGNRNFNQNSGGGGGGYNQGGGGRNYSPNKKFRSNIR